MTSASSKRFRPEHYCISTATSNRHYYHRLSQPQFSHPHTYIHMTTYMVIIITANTNHSSTLHDFPWYLYLTLREGILLLRSPVDPMHIHRHPVKCIFYIHKTKYTFLSFALFFSRNCLTTKITSLYPYRHTNKLHIIYLYLLPNSVLKSSFYHPHSAF